jgi:hypothetical protein
LEGEGEVFKKKFGRGGLWRRSASDHHGCMVVRCSGISICTIMTSFASVITNGYGCGLNSNQ